MSAKESPLIREFHILEAMLAQAESDRDKLRSALVLVLSSATPNPVEHPKMAKAWRIAYAVMMETELTILP